MKTVLVILAVVLACFFALWHFYGKSINRAHLINSANALWAAQEQLRQHGSVTNAGGSIRVYPFTNQVTVGAAEYLGELAADVPGLTNAGRLVATTDGTLIWMDSQGGPVIMRSPGQQIVIPGRFHDF